MKMYDDELGYCVNVSWLMNGHWLVNEDDILWIVPQSNEVAEIDGPDGVTMNVLNAACREHNGVVPGWVVASLGLHEIPEVLRRFDPVIGYFHA